MLIYSYDKDYYIDRSRQSRDGSRESTELEIQASKYCFTSLICFTLLLYDCVFACALPSRRSDPVTKDIQRHYCRPCSRLACMCACACRRLFETATETVLSTDPFQIASKTREEK